MLPRHVAGRGLLVGLIIFALSLVAVRAAPPPPRPSIVMIRVASDRDVTGDPHVVDTEARWS
jgi:hypothetical protein